MATERLASGSPSGRAHPSTVFGMNRLGPHRPIRHHPNPPPTACCQHHLGSPNQALQTLRIHLPHQGLPSAPLPLLWCTRISERGLG